MPFEKNDKNINREGRKKGIKHQDVDSEKFLKHVRANSIQAINTIVGIMNDTREDSKTRLTAAVKLVDKAYEIHIKAPSEVPEEEDEDEQEVVFSVTSVKK